MQKNRYNKMNKHGFLLQINTIILILTSFSGFTQKKNENWEEFLGLQVGFGYEQFVLPKHQASSYNFHCMTLSDLSYTFSICYLYDLNQKFSLKSAVGLGYYSENHGNPQNRFVEKYYYQTVNIGSAVEYKYKNWRPKVGFYGKRILTLQHVDIQSHHSSEWILGTKNFYQVQLGIDHKIKNITVGLTANLAITYASLLKKPDAMLAFNEYILNFTIYPFLNKKSVKKSKQRSI